MNDPLISVLMPVHNAARYVEEAIQSVLTQTYRELELIVVDDGSTDETGAIVERCAQRDDRCQVVASQGSGISAARNVALWAAQALLIAWLDADDVAEASRIERQVAYMKRRPECVVLGSQATLIDEDGDTIGVSDQPLSHEAIERDLWKGLGSAILQPTAMMRKDAVMRVGGYREELQVSEDLDLFLKLAEVGQLANLPDRLVRFRRHCHSISAVGNAIERDNPRAAILAFAAARRGMQVQDFKLSFPPHPASVAEWHAKWAFRAQKNGYPRAARKHALKAFRRGPLNAWSLRALVRVAIPRLKQETERM